MDLPDLEDSYGRTRKRSTSTDPDATIDLLQDPRFRKTDDWFGDASFACKSYPFGGLNGRPKHCPDPKLIEQNVLRAVQEAESCESSDEEDNDLDEEEGGGGGNTTKKSQSIKELPVVSMIRRLATKPSMVAIRFLGWALSKVWRAAFTSVHLHNSDVAVEAVKRSSSRPGTALIILPTHRSHADYLLMSYIFFGLNLPVPLIAAGDNLNVPLLGGLLARAGAFFIRRSKSTPRYRLVLQAYLYELARSGVPVEFFIEGGRSRRGNVGKPKVGLLGMIIQMVRDGDLRDALLLPVSLDYDMVPEGNGFAQEVLGTAKKKPESLFGTIRAAVEWMLWGKRHGNVYVGFGDKILSVSEMITKITKLQQLTGSGSLSMLARQSPSPFDPALLVATQRRKLGGPNGVMVTEEEATKSEKKSLFSPQLHHHHHIPPPAAMFRGGSGTSLATSVLDDDNLALDIGRIVVEQQREASLISCGGVASCAMLMQPPNSQQADTLEEIQSRATHLVNLLVELGHGHRIPDGTLTAFSISSDIETAVHTLGGVTIARTGGAKARVCLRYAANPIIVRLLPVFVVALKQQVNQDFHSWICAMYDVEMESSIARRSSIARKAGEELYDDDDDEEEYVGQSARRAVGGDEDDQAEALAALKFEQISPTLRKDLVELIAPQVIILSAALSLISHWRMDTIVSEEEAIKQVRESLADAPFPELSAPLEIAAAFRACVIHRVLKRTVITPESSGPPNPKKGAEPKKVAGYELEPTYLAPLAKGRSCVLEAKQQIDRLIKS
jgi:1-acyl-sn-glycerol-3-phosphate acyltransferase